MSSRIQIYHFIILSVIMSLTACKSNKKEFRYLALGDSYTIGESVDEIDRWPVQLVNSIREENIKI